MEAAGSSSSQNGYQPHVLAVDDNLVDRKLVEKLLKNSSFKGKNTKVFIFFIQNRISESGQEKKSNLFVCLVVCLFVCLCSDNSRKWSQCSGVSGFVG